ncbi:MAG: nodulation protein S NodS, partial [Candidatus Poseidoniaceae archaeon]
GKDEGMERGHSPAVNEMLEVAFQRVNQGNQPFSFADLGCGNGWVVRMVGELENCTQADGFDGAPHMIEKAKNI